jgi:hypothetical protein
LVRHIRTGATTRAVPDAGLVRFAAVVLVVAAMVMLPVPLPVPVPEAAQPGGECWQWVWVQTGYDEHGDPVYGYRLRNPCDTSAPGPSRPQTCHHPRLGELDCVTTAGWWNSARNCYIKPMSPQPPPGDGLWQGHGPDEGSVYMFTCPIDEQSEMQYFEFLAEPPGVPTVAVLGQEAMRRLHLADPVIRIAPSPDGIGLVGVPVWLWGADGSWGPVGPACVSGPGITVCARAEVVQARWDMGDEHTVTCDGPGTPYRPELGAAEPACGHVYALPSSTAGGRYEVRAETEWWVQWWVAPPGSGAEEEDFTFRESTTSIRIHELQVVTS